ncbi:MAG: hypothetical protein MZU97_07020 [Bacillus subtilis]|nr:hypothetical protein [Bacillus subtilis]
MIDGLLARRQEDDASRRSAHVAGSGVSGVKIHMLHVMKGTALGARYEAEPFPLLTPPEYVSIVCDQLELLPADVVIHRLTGDAPEDLLIAPAWTRRNSSSRTRSTRSCAAAIRGRARSVRAVRSIPKRRIRPKPNPFLNGGAHSDAIWSCGRCGSTD